MTVSPPRTPCAITAARATQASRRTRRASFGARGPDAPARGSGSPTPLADHAVAVLEEDAAHHGRHRASRRRAASRAPDRPEPVLVTSPPTKIKRRVEATSRSDRRWRQGAKEDTRGAADGNGGRFARHPGSGVNGSRPSPCTRGPAWPSRPSLTVILPVWVFSFSWHGLDLVFAGGKALDLERAVLVGDREERVVHDRDVGAHPGVHVAARPGS